MKKIISMILVAMLVSVGYSAMALTAKLTVGSDKLSSNSMPYWPSDNKDGRWLIDFNKDEMRYFYSVPVSVKIEALVNDITINGGKSYNKTLNPGESVVLDINYNKEYPVWTKLLKLTYTAKDVNIETYCIIKQYGGTSQRCLYPIGGIEESKYFNMLSRCIPSPQEIYVPTNITYILSHNEDTTLKHKINDDTYFLHLNSKLKGYASFISGKIDGKTAFIFENAETKLKHDNFIFDNEDLYITATSLYPNDRSEKNMFSVSARNSSNYLGSVSMKSSLIHNLEVINKDKTMSVPYYALNINKYFWHIVFVRTVLQVTNTNNSGAGSLREAINKSQNGDLILLNIPPNSIIKLNEPINIDKSIVIDGGKSNNISLLASGIDLFYIGSDCEIALNNVTIEGTVQNKGNLWINSCILAPSNRVEKYTLVNEGELQLTNSKTKFDCLEGALDNNGNVWIYNCDISRIDNVRSSNNPVMRLHALFTTLYCVKVTGYMNLLSSKFIPCHEGGFSNGLVSTGCLVANNTVFEGLTGGEPGPINNSGTAIINNCEISKCQGAGLGKTSGGITNSGNMLVKNSRIHDNISYERDCRKFSESGKGGGFYNGGNLTIKDSIISQNKILKIERERGASDAGGGGIFNNMDSLLLIENCDINQNSIPYDIWGAGINNCAGTVLIRNSSIKNNTGAEKGGGILNTYQTTLSNVIISGNKANKGGGVYNWVTNMGTPELHFIESVTTISGNEASVNGGGIYNEIGGVIEGRKYLDCHSNIPNNIYQEE